MVIALSQPLLAAASIAQEQPSSAWFGGLGGGFNAISLNQNIRGAGTTDIYRGGVLDSVGVSSGPAVPYDSSDDRLMPVGQLGYFEHFADTSWLWGIKFSYQHDGARSSYPANLPQTGQFSIVAGGTLPFDGNYVVGSAQTRVKHQLSLFPFLGHSFANGFIYGGAGPVLLDVQSNINDVVGFATIYGQRTNITGSPLSLESSDWVWGAGAQAGMTYFLGGSWFLDFNYTFARTQKFKDTFSTPFGNTFDLAAFTYTSSGVANFSISDRLTTQSVTISINKAF